MLIAISPRANVVTVDGRSLSVDCSTVPAEVVHIQWDGARGEIEYFNPPMVSAEDFRGNDVIEDFSTFQPLVDDWTAKAYAIDHPPPPTPPGPMTKDELRAYARQRRWLREVSGIVIGGVAVATDDRSKLMISGARMKAEADPTFVTAWDAADGQIYDLDAPTLIAISDAVANHVNECFTIYKTVSEGITAETVTTKGDIDQAFA